mgnify:CR=1 FL=1
MAAALLVHAPDAEWNPRPFKKALEADKREAEAMASARPVVATAVGGSPEIVVDGVTGLLDIDDGIESPPFALLASLVHAEGIAAVVATHDPAPLAVADRVVEISDGRMS